MLKNIVIFSSSLNNAHSYDLEFEIAKKFDSEINFLKCIPKDHPKFGFFETKSDKVKQEKQRKVAEESIKEFENLAKKANLFTNSHFEFADSLIEYIISFVESNRVDMLIVDSIPPSEMEDEDHKDMVNQIYKNVSCPILTLK